MQSEGNEAFGMNELTGIDRNHLQRDQDYFADISGLFLFAIDEKGNQITDISGRDMRETNRIAGLLNKEQIEDLYNRVMLTKLEEQIVENTEYSNLKIAAVAIKSRNKPILCFIVCAVYYDPDGENAIFNIRSIVDENIFFGGLDFLREIYNRIYDNSSLLENVKLESEKLKEGEKALETALSRTDAMTRIVELLDSEESFDEICDELASVSGKCEKISHTYIIAPNKDAGRVDVRGRYRSENADPVIERVDRQTVLKYASVVGSKPMVVSSRSEIDYDFRLWLGSLGIISFVVLPVFSGRQAQKVSLYLIFADNDPVRLWEKDDIKFFGDVGKVLQSIYDKRLSRESLTSSHISLKVILNNVGSYILVKDKATGEVIFINKRMEEDFSEEIKNGSLENLFQIENEKNDLHKEIYYEALDKTFDFHRNVIKWIDGRYAILISFFEVAASESKGVLSGSDDAPEDSSEASGTGQKPEEQKDASTDEPSALQDGSRTVQVRKPPSIDEKFIQEFILYYQPLIDIKKDNKCMGAEALLRWDSKTLGMMEPKSFLPNARKNGIIIPIGRHIFKQACEKLKAWNESGHPYFKMFVNFSKEEVEQEDFIESLSSSIKETGANPKNVVIEIADIADLKLLGRLEDIFDGIKELGCQISIDDFGTGSLSFASIKELPVSFVKIGQELVEKMAEDLFVQSFVKASEVFFENSRAKLFAEGIENELQLKSFSEMKIRGAQGYCFDPPLDVSEFEKKYILLEPDSGELGDNEQNGLINGRVKA